MTEDKTVGIIGVGHVGFALARNLVNAGFQVYGFRRSHLEAFVSLGGVACESPGELARRSGVVFLCLPSVAAQEEVFGGPAGVLQSARSGQVFVECGSYPLDAKRSFAQRLAKAGAAMIECEISGTPRNIESGTATLLLAGDAKIIESRKAHLEAISPIAFNMGEFGAALAMKTIMNALLAIQNLASAEAMLTGTRAGLDAALIMKVVNASPVRSDVFERKARIMASRQFQPTSGPFETFAKYLDLAEKLAESVGLRPPLLRAALPVYRAALESGRARDDTAAVIDFIGN